MRIEFSKKRTYNIIFTITLIIIAFFMFYWIKQKEGYHEDEIFSYGSSNYKCDNVYQASGKSDAYNKTVEKYVIGNNLFDTLKNVKYYITHNNEFEQLKSEIQTESHAVWKTKEEAKEYVTINKGDFLNYFSVYYNQARDVHPPLFYFVVHLVSSITYGMFSKYIIFTINLLFFIGTSIIISKIFKLYNKKWLTIPTLILYGLSMGAASMLIYLRMYSMLTFFSISYIYLNLKIVENKFEIDKRSKWQLFCCIILGFLTQYYFCIMVVAIFILMVIKMCLEKKYKMLKKYILIHIISAVVGILVYPFSIQHIFFSYRGALNGGNDNSIIFSTIYYIKQVMYGYSINNLIMYVLCSVCIILGIIILVKKISNKKLKLNMFKTSLLIVPTFFYIIAISKLSPVIDEKFAIRYVMPILPIIALIIVFSVEKLCNNNKSLYVILSIVIIFISTNGFITNTPKFLYKGYNKYLEIAEEYKDLDFIYVCDNGFTHINSLPEYMIYTKTLILNSSYDDFAILQNDIELENKQEFVLSIKKWMDVDETLNKVLLNTGFSNYQILLDEDDVTGSKIFLVTK